MKIHFLNYRLFSLLFILGIAFSGCDKDEPEPAPPSTGSVSGVVVSKTNADTIEGAKLILVNANTNEPIGSAITNVDGYYKFSAAGGSYYLRVAAQGYNEIPARGTTPIPFTITNGGNLDNPVMMTPNNSNDIGWITGVVKSPDGNVSGCLVIAELNNEGYSTISSSDGSYTLFNLPSGSYTLDAWKAGIESQTASTTVTANTESLLDISVSSTSGSSVSGSITFLATSNKDIDVALTHPLTEEAIPGMNTMTSSRSYTLTNIPNGNYLARASYVNDGIVMDPDWIVKNGEPTVTVAGANATRNFSVTGAVSLKSPNNDASTTIPVPTSNMPTFEWNKYSSTSDYVIEVQDAEGNTIWGGFSNNWTTKNIVIPSSQSSIAFNSDGNATGSLESGLVYRWIIYASKNNTQSPTGWELISVSEDQHGLIIIN